MMLAEHTSACTHTHTHTQEEEDINYVKEESMEEAEHLVQRERDQ